MLVGAYEIASKRESWEGELVIQQIWCALLFYSTSQMNSIYELAKCMIFKNFKKHL